jgi:hypothetical protein
VAADAKNALHRTATSVGCGSLAQQKKGYDSFALRFGRLGTTPLTRR